MDLTWHIILERSDKSIEDPLTDPLETVRRRCRFGQWSCGHYHVDQAIDERFVIQWGQISKIGADSI